MQVLCGNLNILVHLLSFCLAPQRHSETKLPCSSLFQYTLCRVIYYESYLQDWFFYRTGTRKFFGFRRTVTPISIFSPPRLPISSLALSLPSHQHLFLPPSLPPFNLNTTTLYNDTSGGSQTRSESFQLDERLVLMFLSFFFRCHLLCSFTNT